MITRSSKQEYVIADYVNTLTVYDGRVNVVKLIFHKLNTGKVEFFFQGTNLKTLSANQTYLFSMSDTSMLPNNIAIPGSLYWTIDTSSDTAYSGTLAIGRIDQSQCYINAIHTEWPAAGRYLIAQAQWYI